MSENRIPLADVPVISTTDADQAGSIISARQAPVRIDSVARQTDFSFRMTGQFLQRTFVGFNAFATDTLVRSTQPVEDSVVFILGDQRRTSSYLEVDGERHGFSGASAAVASPTAVGTVWRPGGSAAYVLGLPARALAKRFEDITGRTPEGRAVLQPGVDLASGAGRALQESFFGLVREIENGARFGDHSLLVGLLEDTLINSVLALPGQLRQELERHRVLMGAPQVVRTAEAYMSAHAAEPITLSDLVAVCQTSSSTLYATFKSVRGYTPMQFLASQRLELARKRLMAEPEVSATAIALDCGFNNYGRFARAYRQRFGETPADSRSRRR